MKKIKNKYKLPRKLTYNSLDMEENIDFNQLAIALIQDEDTSILLRLRTDGKTIEINEENIKKFTKIINKNYKKYKKLKRCIYEQA